MPGSHIHIREAFQRRPENLLDVTVQLEYRDRSSAVASRRIAGGPVVRLVNEFRSVIAGTAYLTRMEIGRPDVVGRIGLNRLIRRRVLPGEKGHAWARHHVEEIGTLGHFLPALWAAETGVARAGTG